MRSFFKRPVVFLAVFVAFIYAGDRLLAKLLERIVDSSRFRLSRLYRGDAAADILVLGDSRGVHTFYAPGMEAALGQKVFNLSYNGVSTEIIDCEFHDYLEHNPAPKLLVLEVTNVFSKPDALVNFKPYLDHSSKLTQLFKRENVYEYWGTQISHLYRMNCELFLRLLVYQRKHDQGWILTSRINPDLIDNIRESDAAKDMLGTSHVTQNLAALHRILETAAKKEIDVRLVIAPYLPEFQSKRKNWSQVVEFLQTELKEASPATVPLWDYSQAVTEPDRFSDRVHLNLKGAEALQKRLESDGFFQPEKAPPSVTFVAP